MFGLLKYHVIMKLDKVHIGILNHEVERKCDCICHTTPGVMHFYPCCQNGIQEPLQQLVLNEVLPRGVKQILLKLISDNIDDLNSQISKLTTP